MTKRHLCIGWIECIGSQVMDMDAIWQSTTALQSFEHTGRSQDVHFWRQRRAWQYSIGLVYGQLDACNYLYAPFGSQWTCSQHKQQHDASQKSTFLWSCLWQIACLWEILGFTTTCSTTTTTTYNWYTSSCGSSKCWRICTLDVGFGYFSMATTSLWQYTFQHGWMELLYHDYDYW